MKTRLNKQRQKKWVRLMCWRTLAALITGAGAMLADLDPTKFAMVITFGTYLVDYAMKFVNTELLWDIGVEKPL